MEAMLKDNELQKKYWEMKISDYCCACCGDDKDKVTGCDFDSQMYVLSPMVPRLSAVRHTKG